MKVSKIQLTTPKKIFECAIKTIQSRKAPNSVSLPGEVFQKGGGSHIAFFPADLAKMAIMSTKDSKKYSEQLLKTGNFYETIKDPNIDKLPEWIKKAIKDF